MTTCEKTPDSLPRATIGKSVPPASHAERSHGAGEEVSPDNHMQEFVVDVLDELDALFSAAAKRHRITVSPEAQAYTVGLLGQHIRVDDSPF